MRASTLFLWVALLAFSGLAFAGFNQSLIWVEVSGFVGVISAVISMGDALWQQLEALKK